MPAKCTARQPATQKRGDSGIRAELPSRIADPRSVAASAIQTVNYGTTKN
jgi:hypothetical protein